MITQASAVTGGRKRRIPYVERINAQTPQLASMIQAQRESERADEGLGIQRDQLALNEEMFGYNKANTEREWGMREDAADDAEDKDKLAMMLGLGNLGVQGYMGHKRNTAIESLLTPEVSKATAAPALSKVTPNTPGVMSSGQVPSGSGIMTTPSAKTPGFFSKAGLSNVPGWKSSLTSGSTWLGGMAGTVGANALYKGDNKVKKAAIGAGVGGAVSWAASGGLQKLLSGGGAGGGNPYDTVLGSVLGGIGGLFF